MVSPHRPVYGSGYTQQSGMPKVTPQERQYRPNGLMVRGVVLAVYRIRPNASSSEDALRLPEEGRQTCMYCDVLAYTTVPGQKNRVIYRCLINTFRGGVHEGRLWAPRAAKRDLRSGKAVTTESVKRAAPHDLDGDHVLVGWMDNDFNHPVVICGVPHPRTSVGVGIAADEIGGEVEQIVHRGAYMGFDGRGNFSLDTRTAHGGFYDAELNQPPPPLDGTSGSIFIAAQPGAQLSVQGPTGGFANYPDGTTTVTGGGADDAKSGVLQLQSDGSVLLANGAATRTDVRITADGDVEIDLGDDLQTTPSYTRNITIRGTNYTLEAAGDAELLTDGNVVLGAADESAVLGDTLESQLDSAASALKSQIASAVGGTPAQNAAAIATLVAQITAYVDAVKSAAAAAKSASVTLKT